MFSFSTNVQVNSGEPTSENNQLLKSKTIVYKSYLNRICHYCMEGHLKLKNFDSSLNMYRNLPKSSDPYFQYPGHSTSLEKKTVIPN